jgi:hypothetical protein
VTERELTDQIVARFVERCERLWPGCKVVRREAKQIPAQQPEPAPALPGKTRANEELTHEQR